jgi:hypothetical protein
MKIRLAAATMSLALLAGVAVGSSSSAATAPRVVSHAAAFQQGIDTLVLDSCQDPATWQRFATTQAKAFKKLKANAIGISFPFYTDSATSNNFYAKTSCNPAQNFHTPSTARLAVVITAAHAAGLKVLLRPFLDETNSIQQNIYNWRGNIAPTSPTAWFTNYKNALTPYLKLAQKDHVEHFAISTELQSMATMTSNWAALIKAARKIYTGNLVFTFSWVKSPSEVRPSFTTPGMDTYPAFPTLANSATQGQVLAAWNHLFATSDKLSWISTVADDEVGIPSQDNAYKLPSAVTLPLGPNPFDPTIQVRWFTAACAFAKQHKMRGIYFWGSVLTDHGGALLKTASSLTPGELQPLTQKAIAACF